MNFLNYDVIEKLSKFNREKIPERITHAKGCGAYGYFEVTENITELTSAICFSEIGKKTPVFVRFSNYRGESGSPDTIKDPRGMAIKFYTEEGIWDLTGNNIPVFFINNPKFLPEFAHSQKRNPKTNLFDNGLSWDFFAEHPESLHAVLMNFTDRGIPFSYRFMHNFGCHTYRLINNNNYYFVKFHLISDQGIKNLTPAEAEKIASKNPDFYLQDLIESINKNEYPSWTLKIQVLDKETISQLSFDPFDPTKVWPHPLAPLIEVGRLVLNKNVDNFFEEVEKSAFSPSNLIPGIGYSPDILLQARLIAYPDAQRYRLGVDFKKIKINQSNNSKEFIDDFSYPYSPEDYEIDYYSQPKEFIKILNEKEKLILIKNLIESLKTISKETQEKVLSHLIRINKELSSIIAKELNIKTYTIFQKTLI